MGEGRQMTQPVVTRRGFLATTALGAAGMAVALPRLARAEIEPAPVPSPDAGLKLGVASYSLRKFPRDKAIAMVKALGTPYVNLKDVHLPYELPPEQLAAARREIEAAGLQIVGGGVITFERDSDEDVEKYFAYAKGA